MADNRAATGSGPPATAAPSPVEPSTTPTGTPSTAPTSTTAKPTRSLAPPRETDLPPPFPPPQDPACPPRFDGANVAKTKVTDWDVHGLRGNVMLGGQLLAFLTKYFGDRLGTYDLTAADTTLLDAVISAYNVGPRNVTLGAGPDGIINWPYVNSVKGLMANCPCAPI